MDYDTVDLFKFQVKAMIVLDGKKIALQIQEEIKSKLLHFHNRRPCLAVILVGELAASATYVAMKQKSCAAVGIESRLYRLPNAVSESDLLAEIHKLNTDPLVDGILIQFPLPPHINPDHIVTAIHPDKDVDCFHPINMGKLALGQKGFIPCTPAGIQQLLIRSNIPINGSHVVILGRSHLVGKPLALLLMQKGLYADATVTVAHSRSKNLKKLCLSADILVAAVGSAHFVKADMVREGCVVIDVGIHRTDAGLIGDVDFAGVCDKCSYITPVPGGVGPMTIAMLLSNTVQAWASASTV